MIMEPNQLKNILEAALLAAGRPLDLDTLERLFPEGEAPPRAELRQALLALTEDYAERGIELVEVGSGYRVQSRPDLAEWVSRLWDERPSRYSRALLETLALIAYRQPITRAEVEDVRGVTIASSIIYFGLKSLDELPTLSELRDIDSINAELELDDVAPPKVDLDAFDPELRELAEAAADAEDGSEARSADDGQDVGEAAAAPDLADGEAAGEQVAEATQGETLEATQEETPEALARPGSESLH
jgi:segregation and condensation protein B